MSQSPHHHQGLTGVWDGLFSYPRLFQPTSFTAILFETGSAISGLIHEQPEDGPHAGVLLNASLYGDRSGHGVRFLKTYDPVAGRVRRPVTYEGLLSGDASEIEGRWAIAGDWSGKFLMIRASRALQAAEISQADTALKS